MSKYEMTFIEYFKIRWARRSTWSLMQAAYLSCGLNPDDNSYEISSDADNFVSKRYYWLRNKYEREHLYSVDSKDGIEYFDSGAIVRLLKEKDIPIDENMSHALDHMHNAHLPRDTTGGIVTRTVLREAGRLVFERFPKARILDVALAIEDLPTYFNKRGFGHIDKIPVTTITSYLKNLSDLKQKPKMDEVPEVKIDIGQLTEKL